MKANKYSKEVWKKGNLLLITFEKTLEAKIDDLILSRKIDRIDKFDDNDFEVIGYKSGKLMEEEGRYI